MAPPPWMVARFKLELLKKKKECMYGANWRIKWMKD